MTELTGWARVRQDIAAEVARQIEKTSHAELMARTDALAEKLGDVTLALVQADGSLAARVTGLEELFLGRGYVDIYRDANGVVKVEEPAPQTYPNGQPKQGFWRTVWEILTWRGASGPGD